MPLSITVLSKNPKMAVPVQPHYRLYIHSDTDES